MNFITCYLDFVSPYASLAFDRLPQELEGLSFAVEYRPVVLGAILRHHGHTGPAGIAPKRAWTYRHAEWLAQSMGVQLQLPASHPFDPLPLLRLALACGSEGRVNRHVAGSVLRHVWNGGLDALDPTRLADLRNALAPPHDPAGDEVGGWLRSNTEAAITAGVFGVPTFRVGDKNFWGVDGLPMLRACIAGDAWFEGSRWEDLPARPNPLNQPLSG